MAAKRSASVGIQKLDRIANGVKASPATERRPISLFVARGSAVTQQAYARLPLVGPVGTMHLVSGPGAAMREERRFVTALFADLVGATTLAERLEPE